MNGKKYAVFSFMSVNNIYTRKQIVLFQEI